MADSLTKPQALAFCDALEAENNAAPKPCPDLAEHIAKCRAGDPEALQYLGVWAIYDGDEWEAASLVEYGPGHLAVVVWGEGPRGVVMLADGLFYPVSGNPSGDWTSAHMDDGAGFSTLESAKVAAPC